MFQKLKSSTLLSKINVISSYFWFISTVFFITIIFLSTKGFTIDPCYGKGCSEHHYLLPMLSSFFAGLFFFGLTVFMGFLRVLLKAEKWKPPINLGSWKIGFATFLVVFISSVYVVALFRGSAVRWGGSYTGQDLFNAVNQHRKSLGLKEVKLSEGLCDNLVSRWQAVKEGRQHEGFDDWIKQEGIQTNYGYKELVELYIQALTPAEAITFWSGSPGHRIQLENPKWIDGCAYANEGYGVVVMGIK
ncbi:MAG: hypothetical protein KatS3mg083_581 [Candidatus Dojkabacteria bacterium]|nr:MAG: hypothetical protein KatS3mg083_581 [Candidatus Dojkabacteria bacterium]GIW61216.1 MAG: hypothetical protein KatS3mg089_0068 [Patescibacteria group bacterium]